MSIYFIDLVFYNCLFWKHVRFLDWWISQNFLKTMVSVTIKDSHIILVNVLQRAREQWQPNVPCKIVRSFVSFATKNSYLLTSNGPNDTTLTIHIPPLTWLVWRLMFQFPIDCWQKPTYIDKFLDESAYKSTSCKKLGLLRLLGTIVSSLQLIRNLLEERKWLDLTRRNETHADVLKFWNGCQLNF